MSKQVYSLGEIAELIGAKLQGDPECEIRSMASIQNAQSGAISFLFSSKYKKYLATTAASALVIPEDADFPITFNALLLPNPQLGYVKLAKLFDQQKAPKKGVHPSAVIGENCHIDASVTIQANVVIGDHVTIGKMSVIGPGTVIGDDCVIGSHCHFHANVTLYHGITVGDRVMLHSGVVLGADGFGMINDQGAWQKIPQLGGVTIGNDVEIGANSTIDRGAMDDTIIEDGVKLDNLIMIGHNVVIGAHTAMAGQVGVAGSTTIGRYCMVGGQSGIADHLEIADTVILTGNTFVTKSLEKPGIYSSGIPAEPRTQWHKNIAHYRRTGDLAARVKRLEKIYNDDDQD